MFDVFTLDTSDVLSERKKTIPWSYTVFAKHRLCMKNHSKTLAVNIHKCDHWTCLKESCSIVFGEWVGGVGLSVYMSCSISVWALCKYLLYVCKYVSLCLSFKSWRSNRCCSIEPGGTSVSCSRTLMQLIVCRITFILCFPSLCVRMHVHAHLCALEWQSEAEVSFSWSLPPLYLLPVMIMDWKGRLKRSSPSGSVAPTWSKIRDISVISFHHCTLLHSACCNLHESSKQCFVVVYYFFNALYLMWLIP